MQQPEHTPPVASTSYLPSLAQPVDPLLGFDTTVPDVHGMNYSDQLFQPPAMLLSDPYVRGELVDPSFFDVSDVPPSDLNLNPFVPPSE